MGPSAVISGMGAITSLGRGVSAQSRCLARAERNMALPTLFSSLGGGPAAEIPTDLVPDLPPEHEAVASRANRIAVVAVDEAVESASLSAGDLERTALVVGSTSSGILEGEVVYGAWKPGLPRPDYRYFDDQYVIGAVGRAMARLRGIGGPRTSISTACSSSANALAQAAAGIEVGRWERALVLGVDTLTRMTYFGFGSLGLVSPEACTPFDAGRQGLTLGEAAACLVVESEEAARRRGVVPMVRVSGWARNVDGHHITQPDPEGKGIEACMRAALERAGLEPGDVDHVNAHGTGTRQNDAVEGMALARVFGAGVPVTSTKSYTGHTLGAAGAIEVIYASIAIRDGYVPVTLGLEAIDPDLHIDVVRGEPRRLSIRHVLSNSFGFGGNNCSVVVSAARERA